MILAYGPTETAFTSLGLGAMNPSSCIAKEEINGLFELEIVHPRDNLGKYLRLVVGNIVTAPTHRGTQPFRLYRVETDAMGQVSAWGKTIIAFSASTEINRFEFGAKWDSKMDSGGLIAGEKVKIDISFEGQKQ